jgi:Arylsulfotransferase (ASST)
VAGARFGRAVVVATMAALSVASGLLVAVPSVAAPTVVPGSSLPVLPAAVPTVAGSFVPVAPARVLDTRSGTGAPKAAVGANATVHLQVLGRGGVPAAGVSAVVLNVTVTRPSRAGVITAWPDGSTRPTASNLNFVPGQTVPNLVVVQVGANGKVALRNTSAGSTHLVADVAGYHLDPAPTASVDLGPSMSPRPDLGVTDFVVSCPTGSVTATVTARHGGSVVLDGGPAQTASGDVTVPLSPGQAVRWTLSRPGQADIEQRARCVPADLPTWQTTRSGTPASQWYVLSPTAGSGAAPTGSPLYVVVADDRGTPVWWQAVTTHRPVDAKLAPGGTGLMWGEAGFTYALSTLYHQVGWDGVEHGTIGAGADIDMHDLVPATEGGWYALRYVPRDCLGSGDCADMRAYGGTAADTIIDGEVVRLDAAGSVVWRWKTRDHLTFPEWGDLVPDTHTNLAKVVIDGKNYWDVVHLNSVEHDGDGLIISARHLDAVYRIRTSDGSVDWKLGGTTTARSLSLVGDDTYPFLNSQHDARRLPNGHLTVFDNGTEGFRTPRVLEVAVDPGALTASVVRSVEDARSTFSPCCGSARAVPSGGFAVAWGGTGLLTETDASGVPVLTLDTGIVFSYRLVPVAPGTVARTTIQSGMDAMHPRPVGG